MARLDRLPARIVALTRVEPGVVFADARADGEDALRPVVAYPDLTGPLAPGDRVLLNATATALRLGTGGFDFVIAVENGPIPPPEDHGEHLVKLRYTPHQHAVVPAEFGPGMDDFPDLADLTVVVCGLHSQIAPVAAGVRAARPDARVACVQTDAGALPVAFSDLLRRLRDAGLIDVTLSSGQAFGADLECVALPSALQAARVRAGADVAIVAQGPGNAGTGTALGFSGIEQGWNLDVAAALGARAVGVLRGSDADPRPRHRGLSHHSVTALGRICGRRATVAVPQGWPAFAAAVRESAIGERHAVVVADGAPGLALLAERGVRVRSMGRTPDDDPLFFHAAAAAGAVGVH